MNGGHTRSRQLPQAIRVYGNFSPSEHSAILYRDGFFNEFLCLFPDRFDSGQKDHSHAVSAAGGQINSKFFAFFAEEYMGDLRKHSRAVARFRIATRRAAIGEVDEHLKTLADNVVALFAANAGDQAHAAGVVLVARMVKPLRARSANMAIR